MLCLLCQSPHSEAFKVEKKPERSYFHCAECDLIFMNPAERLDPQQEKARYDHHENQESAGYVSFLEPLVNEIDKYFKAANLDPAQLSVLDFGCGPTAVLSKLFAQKGYRVANYDLYYNPNQELLKKQYHLITSTEVWEHLYNPREEIERQLKMLKAGGLLGIMTSAHRGEGAFHDWHYRRDLTHVVFFSEKTMQWLAEHFRLHVIKAKSPYWIFQKLY
ncbi:class I SAM-dependent methyltransferase [Bdellovibrio sp. 22V]|uniref:class I SAM-dependent methyltransferase n=1 Tax=Bdellovibrio sp. 22V TaxID=3044166 RepID=UPI002543FBA9|nr:class I SAM-dependent methyltransferase [Bdellovibrio sp. 22V]WII71424.1 class I SAM-dependent methyltransferase [Bdellovibrio sp. 22V]